MQRGHRVTCHQQTVERINGGEQLNLKVVHEFADIATSSISLLPRHTVISRQKKSRVGVGRGVFTEGAVNEGFTQGSGEQ
jgi:hypothetical protein